MPAQRKVWDVWFLSKVLVILLASWRGPHLLGASNSPCVVCGETLNVCIASISTHSTALKKGCD